MRHREQNMVNNLFIVFFIVLCVVLSFFNAAEAKEDKEEPKITKERKEVQGEVGRLGKGYIALVYKKDEEKGIEYEIQMPLASDLKLERKRSLSQIGQGDTVLVVYEETTTEYKGKSKKSRIAKVIRFIRPNTKKIDDFQEEEEESEEDESFIKGYKSKI